jgi:hypothetical protein
MIISTRILTYIQYTILGAALLWVGYCYSTGHRKYLWVGTLAVVLSFALRNIIRGHEAGYSTRKIITDQWPLLIGASVYVYFTVIK